MAASEHKITLKDLETQFFADPSGFRLELELCRRVDDIVCAVARSVSWDSAVLLAVGGYGRGAMHPASDVDLLFLFGDAADEEVVKSLLHVLWDKGLNIGHQVRTVSDFVVFAPGEIESHAAFLDARLLAGDRELAMSFSNMILPSMIAAHREAFIAALLDSKHARHARFGDTLFQLEPDVKDAPGGVRDYSWVGWVRKARGLDATDPAIEDPVRFLYRLRNFLHFFAGRNANALSYENQERIAPLLGYRDSERGEAAELLMSDYFGNAGRIARAVSRCEEEVLSERRAVSFQTDVTGDLLAVFARAHRRKVRLDCWSLDRIEERVRSGPTSLREGGAAHAVLNMMKDIPGIYDTLSSMHASHVLGSVFPEFEQIRGRVIRDFFHKYTVDEHSLIAIRNIEELAATPGRFSELIGDLEHPELLLLSLLFHDLGKGHRHPEDQHVCGSVEEVKEILGRLNLPDEQSGTVTFLVANHLEMSRVIQRRDFTDETVVRRFAELVGTRERLRLLTLMTFADIKAVNPEVLTPWKEELLWQLYVETHNELVRGAADDRYIQEPGHEAELDAVLSFLRNALGDFLDGFPRRYLKSTPLEEIAEHFRFWLLLKEKGHVIHIKPRAELFELLVMTADRPSLFSKIAGVLSCFGMNILRGEAFANGRGIVLDLITFADPHRTFALNPTEVERFESMLARATTGSVQMEELLRGKMSSIMYRPRRGVVTPSIHFDDQSSSRYTVAEIVAPDSFGLLYSIASIISAAGCNIEVALINTEGHKAIDVFYLSASGGKLTPGIEEQLRFRLLSVLEPQQRL